MRTFAFDIPVTNRGSHSHHIVFSGKIIMLHGILRRCFVWLSVVTLTGISLSPKDVSAEDNSSKNQKIKVVFSGGHETNPVDRGRPVVLVAGALGVKPEEFREAFSRVRPAPGGREPEPSRVRENKAVLMKALAPLGVTNERLDEVSNHYRIRPGEVWPTKPAEAYALVKEGRIVSFEVVHGGTGYSSPPQISVPGYSVPATQIELSYGKDFSKNGAVSSIKILKK